MNGTQWALIYLAVGFAYGAWWLHTDHEWATEETSTLPPAVATAVTYLTGLLTALFWPVCLLAALIVYIGGRTGHG